MGALKVKIYQISSGEHVVCYKDPVSQKRKRKKFDLKADAKKHKASLDLRFQEKGPQSFNQTPLSHYLDMHLEESPNSSILERKIHFESFLKEFGNKAVNQVGRAELSAWFAKVKEKNDLSDRTLNTIKSNVNAFFRYLEDEEVITSSPLRKIRFERKPPPRRERVVLSPDEIYRILEGAKVFSPRILYPILFIAAYTGARRGEVLKLKRKDVDLESDLLHFRFTKNGEDRSIRINGKFREFLKSFLESHNSDHAIPYIDGGRIPPHIVGKHLRRFRKQFPIGKSWGPHSLRHSFAHNFLKKGKNMYQLQAILGHKSIDVTVDIYGQIGAQDVENACPYDN